MKKIVIEPHYLGSLEYFSLIHQYDEVMIEINDSFPKQTYRNRMHLLVPNKVLVLTTPLNYRNHTLTKDVKIDYSQRWIKDHWGALCSAYGKAPYFDFFAEDFKGVWDQHHEFLLDLLMDMIAIVLKMTQLEMVLSLTDKYEKMISNGYEDYRDVIRPKIDFFHRNIHRSLAYTQLFGDNFVPNLSIVDLIMCEGTRAGEIIQRSTFRGK